MVGAARTERMTNQKDVCDTVQATAIDLENPASVHGDANDSENGHESVSGDENKNENENENKRSGMGTRARMVTGTSTNNSTS
jgi:hypothetical protein